MAELEQARLSWGVWADGVRQLAERRLGVGAAEGPSRAGGPGICAGAAVGRVVR